MKLGLGTVQFGTNYGISNQYGLTSAAMVAEILAIAKNNNIHVLDTAPLYGYSEEVLGKVLGIQKHPFTIITKTSKLEKAYATSADGQKIQNTFYQSLEKLQQLSIYGLLFHDPADLLVDGGEYLYEAAVTLKQKNKVKKIGVSVYTEEQVDKLINRYSLDLIQVPINVFDQRLLHSGCLRHLYKANIEIHARSIFLQGLLLMDIDAIPSYFAPIYPHLARYRDFLIQEELSPLAASLGFVMGLTEVDTVICGVNNSKQLQQILAAQATLAMEKFKEFQLQDECFLNPAQWEV